MSDQSREQGAGSREFSREDMQSALFAQLIMQQSNLAMMLLGKGPAPEGGQAVRDLESAQLLIDQLEMLEVKTKGNLNKHEAALLKQSLMALQMAFVEAVESPAPPAKAAETPASPAAPETASAAKPENKTAPREEAGAAAEAESKKRYSKKFSL
jgi:hypothetical protein